MNNRKHLLPFTQQEIENRLSIRLLNLILMNYLPLLDFNELFAQIYTSKLHKIEKMHIFKHTNEEMK